VVSVNWKGTDVAGSGAGSGFNIKPTDLHSSGSSLTQFGDQIASGGDKLQTVGQKLASGASKDKSGVGKVISKMMGTGTEVAGKVFSEGGRVAGAAGKRLHSNASAHEQNESDLTNSFKGIDDPKSTGHTPKPDTSGGGSSSTPKGGDSGPGFHDPKTPKAGDSNTNPHENSTPSSDLPYCGDPIDVSTGRMVLTQVDAELAGAFPLVMTRTHVSGYRLGRWFGSSWTSTVDQRLSVEDDGVHLTVEDGRLLSYPTPVGDEEVLPVAGARWPLSRLADDTGFVVTDPDEERAYYFAVSDGSRFSLSAMTDGDGNQIDLVYDATGVLTELRHSAGYRVSVRTSDGVITGLYLIEGEVAGDADRPLMRYTYDEQRRLVAVLDSSDRAQRFEYDADGRIVRWDDRNGMWYSYRFDAAGRCVAATGAGDYLNVSLAYDRDAMVTTVTDSLGNDTRYQFDERLRLVAQTDPLGNTTLSEWDADDRLVATVDALGRTTRYGYDAAGDLTDVARPDGSRSVAEFDDRRRPVATVEPDGSVWRREYGPTGKLVRTTDPLGATTTYGYDAAGNVATVTDALGNVTSIESNAAGLPVTVTDPLGAVTRYEYDPTGRVRTIVDPLGAVTRSAWSVQGELTELVEPDGSVWRWNHDGEGNNTEEIDADGQVTRTEFAHFDLPVAAVSPTGGRLAYAYDTELRLVAVTNEQGLVWRYTYDAAGRLTEETDFNGRTLRYTYDAAGQLIRQVNGSGEAITIERDTLGRMVRRTAVDGVSTFEYDLADRMVRARGADADVTFGYDRLGRVLTETLNGRQVRSDYDPLGRRVRLRTPSGAESVWDYDAAGRPVALRAGGRTIGFDHDPAGQEVLRSIRGAGAGTTSLRQTWDANHRLTAQTLSAGGTGGAERVLQRREYGYRTDGYLTSVTDGLSGPRQISLDPVGRVQGVVGRNWQERYAYDPAGNITEAGWPASSAAIGRRHYAGTLLVAAGGLRYQHDAEGRITTRQRPNPAAARTDTWHYQWNSDSRLVAVITPDRLRWRYRYDAIGRRVAKQRLGADGAVVEQFDFTWDGAQLVEQLHTGAGLRPAVTVWAWEPDGTTPVIQLERELAKDPVAERFYAIVADLVGSPSELVDEAGAVAWHGHTTLWGALLSGPGSASTPLRFPGQYHDPETGLHYNLHRYYDPETGRFLSHDPLGLEAGADSLAYVANPTAWIDPLGLAACKPTKGASGSGGGGGKPPPKPNSAKAAALGTNKVAKPKKPSAPRQTYRPGTYGATGAEQKRTGTKFGQKVSGDTHESEHPIGYEVLGRGTGVKRGENQHAKDVENHAPAYQEAKPAHKGHIGTGTKVNPDAMGTSAFKSSQDYRDSQRNALESTDKHGAPNKDAASNAIQLNQVEYAHQQSFHTNTSDKDVKAQGGAIGGNDDGSGSYYTTGNPANRPALNNDQRIADDSYHHMVDNQQGHGIRYSTAPGAQNDATTAPMDKTGAAEAHLGRDMARTGQHPSEQQISDALYPAPTAQQRQDQALADGLPANAYDPPQHGSLDDDDAMDTT
jgi:RHS repeat-associated protein